MQNTVKWNVQSDTILFCPPPRRWCISTCRGDRCSLKKVHLHTYTHANTHTDTHTGIDQSPKADITDKQGGGHSSTFGT